MNNNLSVLFTDATNVNYLNPNSLSVTNPYRSGDNSTYEISEAFTSQGVNCFVICNNVRVETNNNRSCGVYFVPTDESAIYTVTLWVYNRPLGVWMKPQFIPTQTYTGSKADYVELEGLQGQVCYFSIDSISTGSLSCCVMGSVAKVNGLE